MKTHIFTITGVFLSMIFSTVGMGMEVKKIDEYPIKVSVILPQSTVQDRLSYSEPTKIYEPNNNAYAQKEILETYFSNIKIYQVYSAETYFQGEPIGIKKRPDILVAKIDTSTKTVAINNPLILNSGQSKIGFILTYTKTTRDHKLKDVVCIYKRDNGALIKEFGGPMTYWKSMTFNIKFDRENEELTCLITREEKQTKK